MTDIRPQLQGRGFHGPLRLPRLRGPMHLWNHVSMPPAQNSLIVYTNGEVIEGNNFAAWEINQPDVLWFITGGQNVREGDLPPQVDEFLLATGQYWYGQPATIDVYPADDQYPVDDVYPLVLEETP